MNLFRVGNQSIPDNVLIAETNARHHLAQQLFYRRDVAGWSQERLAEVAGTTQAQIANLEAGHVNPTLLTIVRLAEALECKAADLLRPTEEVESATFWDVWQAASWQAASWQVQVPMLQYTLDVGGDITVTFMNEEDWAPREAHAPEDAQRYEELPSVKPESKMSLSA